MYFEGLRTGLDWLEKKSSFYLKTLLIKAVKSAFWKHHFKHYFQESLNQIHPKIKIVWVIYINEKSDFDDFI